MEELEYVDIKVSKLPDIYELEEEAEMEIDAEGLAEFWHGDYGDRI